MASFENRGEARNRGGMRYQDKIAAKLIYEGLVKNSFHQVSFLNPNVGKFDDCVIKGQDDILYCYQIKHRKNSNLTMNIFRNKENPETPSIISQCYDGFNVLKHDKSITSFRLIWLFNKKLSSVKTKGYLDAIPINEQNFSYFWFKIRAKLLETNNFTSINEEWYELIKDICSENEIVEGDFIDLLNHIDFIENQDWKKFEIDWPKRKLDEVLNLAEKLTTLISENLEQKPYILNPNGIIRFMRWNGKFKWEHIETFSSPQYGYIHNQQMEEFLLKQIRKPDKKYIGLNGSPGSGKSTFLDAVFRSKAEYECIYYFLYTPDQSLILDSIGDEMNFIKALVGKIESCVSCDHETLIPSDFDDLYRRFITDLNCFSQFLTKNKKKGLIIIDGLDHINREYKRIQNLCKVLPKLEEIPDNITIILGSQSYNIDDIPSSIRVEIETSLVEMKPFTIELVHKYLGNVQIDLDSGLRDRLLTISQGHPLILKYCCEFFKNERKLNNFNSDEEILTNIPPFSGDIYKYYDSIINSYRTNDNSDLLELLYHICRISLPFDIYIFLQGNFQGSTIQIFLQTFGFLFKIQNGLYSFFHNSFRQFLLKKNKELDPSGKMDEFYHEKLFKLYFSFENTKLEYFNAFEHAIKSSNMEYIQAINFQAHTISQFEFLRPKSLIERDILFLLNFAMDKVDFNTFIESILAGLILGLMSSNSGNVEIIKNLIKLGKIDLAKQWIYYDNSLLIKEHEARLLIFELLKYDSEFARNLFYLTDPSKNKYRWKNLSQLSINYANIKNWIECAPFFWDYVTIIDIVENWSYRSQNAEETKSLIFLLLTVGAVRLKDKEMISKFVDNIPMTQPNIKMNAFTILMNNDLYSESWNDQLFNLISQNLSKKIFFYSFKAINSGPLSGNETIFKAIDTKLDEIVLNKARIQDKDFFPIIQTYLLTNLYRGNAVDIESLISSIKVKKVHPGIRTIPEFIRDYFHLLQKMVKMETEEKEKVNGVKISNFLRNYYSINFNYSRDLYRFIDWDTIINFFLTFTKKLNDPIFWKEMWQIFKTYVFQFIKASDPTFNLRIILNFYYNKVISLDEAEQIWFEYVKSQEKNSYTYERVQFGNSTTKLMIALGKTQEAYQYINKTQQNSLGFLNDKDIQLEAFVKYLILNLEKNKTLSQREIQNFFDLLNHANKTSDSHFFYPASQLFSFTLKLDYKFAFQLWNSEFKNELVNLESGFKLILEYIIENQGVEDSIIFFKHIIIPISSSASWELAFNLVSKIILDSSLEDIKEKVSSLIHFIEIHSFPKIRKKWILGIGLATENHESFEYFNIDIDGLINELKLDNDSDIKHKRENLKESADELDLTSILKEKINFHDYWITNKKFEILKEASKTGKKKEIVKFLKENLSRPSPDYYWIIHYLDDIAYILFDSELISNIWPHVKRYLHLLAPKVQKSEKLISFNTNLTTFLGFLLSFIWENVFSLSNYHMYELVKHFFKFSNNFNELSIWLESYHRDDLLISSFKTIQEEPKLKDQIIHFLQSFTVHYDIEHLILKKILGENHPNIILYEENYGKPKYSLDYEEEIVNIINQLDQRIAKPSFIDTKEISEIHLTDWRQTPNIQIYEISKDNPTFSFILAEISYFKIFSHTNIVEKREILRIDRNYVEKKYNNQNIINNFPYPTISLKKTLLDDISWSFNQETSEFLNHENEIVGKKIIWQDGNIYHKGKKLFQYAGIGTVILLNRKGFQYFRKIKPDYLSNDFKVIRNEYSKTEEFDLTP